MIGALVKLCALNGEDRCSCVRLDGSVACVSEESLMM